jgi:hypothetical protein
VEWQIAELQTALHQAELDLEDQRAKIAVVPAPASESPEKMKAQGRRINSISCRAKIILFWIFYSHKAMSDN